MAGLMITGAVPFVFVGLVTTATHFYILRFFMGVLGGTFVPCQVWTTVFCGWRNVGTVNALAGGWGNAGAGIAFFAMPALINALHSNLGLSEHNAWRVSFLVLPFGLLIGMSLIILQFGDDCPEGKWCDRVRVSDLTLASSANQNQSQATLDTNAFSVEAHDALSAKKHPDTSKPQRKEYLGPLMVTISPPTLLVSIFYLCSFGGGIALETFLVTWYQQESQSSGLSWNAQQIGAIGSIYGLLNIVTRPMGGYLADVLYRAYKLKSKKQLLVVLWICQTLVLLLLGLVPNMQIWVLVVMSTLYAVFTQMGNGATFALVPHIHPAHIGLVSGIVGAWGNLGAIVFSVVYYKVDSFAKSFWINGVVVGVCCLFGVCLMPLFNNDDDHLHLQEDEPKNDGALDSL